MPNLILYNYFRSSTSYRARIALALKGLTYEYKSVHLINNGGEQHSPEFRKLNPMGGVPTLIHDGQILSQSFAIIEYLDEAFPNKHRLFPEDLFKKALVREFCQIINADIHSYANLKTLQYLENKLNIAEPQRLEWLHHFLGNGLQACEKILEKRAGQYCFGDSVTAADCFLVPMLFTAKRFNVPLDSLKNCQRVNDNCLSLESFKIAHPYNQPDTPAELRN